MSENFNQICKGLMQDFESLEAKMQDAEDKLADSTHDAVETLKARHQETNARIAELKADALQKIAELRQSLASKGDAVQADVEAGLDGMRQEMEQRINETEEAWHKAVSDVTGGAIM